jgi:hypothetical protein
MKDRRRSPGISALVLSGALSVATVVAGNSVFPKFDVEPPPTGYRTSRLIPASEPILTSCRGDVPVGKVRQEVSDVKYKGSESHAPRVDEKMPFPKDDTPGLVDTFNYHSCAVEYDARDVLIQGNTVVPCNVEMTVRQFNQEQGIVYDNVTSGGNSGNIKVKLFDELQKYRKKKCEERLVNDYLPIRV